ncbi:myb-like protein X isoform X2 [Hydractinia symbiolongicarpus]|uniref:myb-like protein X isoform X2 n=1 Tax=Hydractinia symbiolongicarpus TaxID=13093 RepID=UPI0025515996|nr:myb-like protein X isoform X2 [Hydractinia symbiolongicarpus]
MDGRSFSRNKGKVFAKPLDIVAGKSGEQQVKEALDKAEKESEQAAKETRNKEGEHNQEEAEHFTSSGDKSTRSSTDLKETLDKKVAELAKFHEKPKSKEDTHVADVKEKEVADLNKGDKEISAELTSAETKEKENAALEEESDKKMVEMAKKLNNLVLKFQKKMGRLDHRPKNAEELIPEKDGDGETTVKSIRGKPATHAPIDLAALMSAIRGKQVQTRHPLMLNVRTKPAPPVASDLVSTGLRNALGLLHTKAVTKSGDESATKTSYKEDTKLEDRLAMEAEEEKKFSNGDTYDDGEDEAASKSSTGSSSSSASSSLSPKEQASQEMQNYNALISSESNRELTQIQDEITKATQSSMGQVSVVGQKEQVNTESPNLPNIPGIGESSFSGLGGAGGLSGLAGAGGLSSLSSTSSFSNAGGLGGTEEINLGSLGGSSAADQFQGLQGGATEGLDPNTGSPQIPNQATSPLTESSMTDNNGISGQTMSAATQLNMGGQSPIEIGSSNQTPVEMGTLSGGANNPFRGSQSGQQMENVSPEQMQNNFMSQGGQQQSLELGQIGGEQQQRMSFKKSKISDEREKKDNRRKKYQLFQHKHHAKTKVQNRQRS